MDLENFLCEFQKRKASVGKGEEKIWPLGVSIAFYLHWNQRNRLQMRVPID